MTESTSCAKRVAFNPYPADKRKLTQLSELMGVSVSHLAQVAINEWLREHCEALEAFYGS